MNWLGLLMLPSLIAIVTLPMIRNRRVAARWSASLTVVSFLLAIHVIILVYFHQQTLNFLHGWFICDILSAFFILLNTFIAMTTAFYAMGYLNYEAERAHLYPIIYRFYHTFYHAFIFSMLMVLLSNNLGILWIAMETATITSVILVGLYQTPQALEAAWKYLILCGVGIGLALLGTTIIYFAAHSLLIGYQGLQWTSLMKAAPKLSAKLLEIAFVFIFIGYGTKVGFFPLHNWLPDAHSEGPSPISALLSGLLLNVALFAILRFKLILDHTTSRYFAQTLLLLFGFMNLLFAALALLRQRKLKRLFAYSSIEHMGLISIALGMGTPLAYLAGLLHILMHSLSKTAAFFSSGTIIQRFHTQTISRLKGIRNSQPITAWLLFLSTLAILGMPPSGLFLSELLLLYATLQVHAWLTIPLVIGLGLSFLAIFVKVQSILFSEVRPLPISQSVRYSLQNWPVIIHLLLVLLAGFWIPFFLLKPVIAFFMHGYST